MDLYQLSAVQIVERLAAGELGSIELVEALEGRADEIDGGLNAFVPSTMRCWSRRPTKSIACWR